MKTSPYILGILLTACSGSDFSSIDIATGGSSAVATGGSSAVATGGSSAVATGGSSAVATGANSTVIDGITVHSDMSGYTYSCFTPSQKVIGCLSTLSGIKPTQYAYCTTMLSQECLNIGLAAYECLTC